MAQDSKIQWTTHTFNPWRGCTKVSDGCKHCYADTLSKRNPKALGIWGPSGTRVVASESMWREPAKWDRLAKEAGERHRVFCASLADVFEGEDTMPSSAWPVIQEARKRLFDLICRTPNLDWLLLTKRPQNALRLMVDAGLYAVANPSLPCPQPNIWIGTSVEDQKAADGRIPLLLRVPAAVRFLSCEPLLAPVNLRVRLPNVKCAHEKCGHEFHEDDAAIGSQGWECPKCGRDEFNDTIDYPAGSAIGWVIIGGESGAGARPFYTNWADSLRDQCEAAGVPIFIKQMGSNHRCVDDEFGDQPIELRDSKGGDWSEWPADLRVREFPARV